MLHHAISASYTSLSPCAELTVLNMHYANGRAVRRDAGAHVECDGYHLE